MQWWPVGVVWIIASLAMLLAWLVQRHTRNAGIVHVVWALCMGGSALFYAMVGDGSLIARLGVAMLGGIWGFRLCLHILSRLLYEHEDGRYRYLREYSRLLKAHRVCRSLLFPSGSRFPNLHRSECFGACPVRRIVRDWVVL